jgi:hypothetical protein
VSTLSTYGRASLVGLVAVVAAACGADVAPPQGAEPGGHANRATSPSDRSRGSGSGDGSDTSSTAPTSLSSLFTGSPSTGATSPLKTTFGGGDFPSGSQLTSIGGVTAGAPFPVGAPDGSSAGITAKGGCPAQLAPGWLAQENRQTGTTAWQDARRTRAGTVNGYLSQVSAACGDSVAAYLTGPVTVLNASVTAYRMGYYGGAGGREIWKSDHVAIAPQLAPTVDPATLMVEANWQATLQIPVTAAWTPGYYMIVVRAPGQTASSIPLVVRADGDNAPLAYQASVLTYQAYNTYGGFSAYAKSATDHRASKVVSFDRPYDDGGYYSPYQYELPLISEIEKLGIDTDYTTDIDVDAAPQELLAHKALITGGHSEYWTRRMYDGAEAARDAGVNLAFFGANAVYTAARLQPDATSLPARRAAIYRSVSGDPMAAANASEATVNWGDSPLNRPEAGLVGQGYGYVGASGGLRVLHPTSWIFAGTAVAIGQVLPDTVGGEYDQVDPSRAATPKDIDVLAAMPMRFKNGQAGMASTTYYVATSQAGVFDAGTTYWPCTLAGNCLHMPADQGSRAVVRQMTDNILTAFAAGPAGLEHPSTPNLPPSPEGLVSSAATAGDVAQREF